MFPVMWRGFCLPWWKILSSNKLVSEWVPIISWFCAFLKGYQDWKPELLVGVESSSWDSALLVLQEVQFRLLFSSSSMEKTKSPCSSSILLVLTGDETVRSRRPLAPTDEEWRAGPGWSDILLSCCDIMDVDCCREGVETKGETSPDVCRLPMGPRLGLAPKFNEDSRRGDPTCGSEVPCASSSFFCRCFAKRAPNLDGLDARGEPTFERLVPVIPSPLRSRWLELGS